MDNKVLYGKTPISKLFTIVAIPGVISMLVSSLYQIIDGMFVGQLLGSTAFAALNLVMPLVILNFSIADLVGVGSAVPIAIKLGEKDEHTASRIFSSACLLIIGLGVVLGSILFVFAEDFVRMMGADESLTGMAAQYLRVYALCSPFTTIVFAVDNYLRICGKVRYSMMVNIFMSVISAVLEFIFLGVLHLGIWGAALATCLGMFLCALIAFAPFFRKKTQLYFAKPSINGRTVRLILTNGAPTFLNNVAGRMTSIVLNILLLRYGGATAVSAYGVLMYAEGFILPVLYGLCDSLQPAIGYNYGAGNPGRIKAIVRRCMGASATVSIVMTAAMLALAPQIVRFFVKPEETALTAMAVHALGLFALSFLTRWLSLAIQSYLSVIGRAGYATIISLCVALVFPLGVLAALSSLQLEGVWLNQPTTCVLAGLLSIGMLIHYRRRGKPNMIAEAAEA